MGWGGAGTRAGHNSVDLVVPVKHVGSSGVVCACTRWPDTQRGETARQRGSGHTAVQ